MEPKMENPPHTFKETNLVLQLVFELLIKSKNDKLEFVEEKKCTFSNVYFALTKFL